MEPTTDFFLPQTNLQLYRVLLEQGHEERDLALVRAAYDIARHSFVGNFRPNHKPFLCHLVGTAGALAMWKQPLQVVVAGLLHSVYLFGDFDDGDRGVTRQRRDWIRGKVGDEIEQLVYQFSSTHWDEPIDQMLRTSKSVPAYRKLATIKLADTLDEIADAGILYSTEKPMRFGLCSRHDDRKILIDSIAGIVHREAADHFGAALNANEQMTVPPQLRTSDRMSKTICVGVKALRRNVVWKRIHKWKRKISRAA